MFTRHLRHLRERVDHSGGSVGSCWVPDLIEFLVLGKFFTIKQTLIAAGGVSIAQTSITPPIIPQGAVSKAQLDTLGAA